jgi:hypothetical protein
MLVLILGTSIVSDYFLNINEIMFLIDIPSAFFVVGNGLLSIVRQTLV